jgi:hypothetical protein
MKTRILAAAALLLSACATEYTYTPPATAEGKACVGKCQGTQQACRDQQDTRASRARRQCEEESDRREEKCEVEASADYLACLRYARTEDERKACQKRTCDASACSDAPHYSLCDSDYRACYENCGGKVDVRD